ncbi:T9SS type A sorting domain-containing protein [Emticicia sp. BO119]|uniref:T9SS type A sorting domain-containing protein n=1 Tax=Emticicia sp. BO119 TaxID=2757768 RepID=UPI0015F0119A|nr:T9SS type A sorting domain-containing protein [Emticicia sp. BO119]MBA4849694.1 T9SS type A sorting domain-containing protein [Emticicia sp. BO119]
MLKKKWLVIVLSFTVFSAYSQIQITFPVSRIVFQRNNNNQANVNIAGSYFQQLDRIDARAFPVSPGQGNEVGWTTIQDFLTTGIFNGFLQLSGGWYNIEVRGVLNGQVVTSTVLERVGVGEVFIVAGQSNAQGDPSYSGGAIGASDDRVSTIDYYDAALNENQFPFQFSHMGNFSRMAPYNYVPWFWGRLGDRLTQRYNVPVLFYGAALGGIGVNAWQRSSNGEDLRKELPSFIAVPGMPYRALKAALQQYVTRTGVRAVLWQQGESDDQTSSNSYFNNLKIVIEKSRNDSGKGNLAWVIARSSRNPNIHQNVIDGQNVTIGNVHSVYPGPNTDEIFGANFRADGVHFHNDGLNRAAEYWNAALNDGFFSSSQPLESRGLVNVSLSCNPTNPNNRFTIQVNGEYQSFNWSNGNNNRSIIVNNGSYTVKTTDWSGNTLFSQPVPISPNNPVIQPSINVTGPTTFCDGGSVALIASEPGGNVWSNGERGQAIVARTSGSYVLTNYTLNGCPSVSGSVNVNVNPLPRNNILTTKELPICPDDSITLVTDNFENVTYQWNTNASSQNIVVKDAGTYSLKLRDQNGCESTSFIEVGLRDRPVTEIIPDGPTIFCLGKSVNLNPNADFNGYFWSNGVTTKSNFIKESGEYSLRVKDGFGCISLPVSQNVIVNPLPSVKIAATGLEQFCPGNVVNLAAASDENFVYMWNTGAETKDVTIESPGLYTLRVRDINGCESMADSISLSFIPPPSVSISTVDNINTICEGSNITLNGSNAVSYVWSNGATSKDIIVEQEATYVLKIRDEKNCESDPVSFHVFVKDTPPTPVLEKDGAYQVIAIPATNIPGQYFNWKLDETTLTDTTSIVKVRQQGNFAVRTALKYSNTNNSSLVCYSPFSQVLSFLIPIGDNGLRVYPNPNPTGLFTIETFGDNPNSKIDVFTLSGLNVFTGSISELKEKRELNLRMLEPGVYIIRLTSGDFKATQKLLIKY